MLPGMFGQEREQFGVIHAVQRGQIDTECVGNRRQIESELHQQVDEVQLVAGERVPDDRAGEVALRPRARVQPSVAALVRVLLDVVDIVHVESQRRTTKASVFCRCRFRLCQSTIIRYQQGRIQEFAKGVVVSLPLPSSPLLSPFPLSLLSPPLRSKPARR